MNIRKTATFTAQTLLLGFIAVCVLLCLAFSATAVTAYRSSTVWQEVKNHRHEYWDALEQKASPTQKADVAFVRAAVEGQNCQSRINLEQELFANRAQTRLSVLQREKECLSMLDTSSLGTSQTSLHALVKLLEDHTDQKIREIEDNMFLNI